MLESARSPVRHPDRRHPCTGAATVQPPWHAVGDKNVAAPIRAATVPANRTTIPSPIVSKISSRHPIIRAYGERTSRNFALPMRTEHQLHLKHGNSAVETALVHKNFHPTALGALRVPVFTRLPHPAPLKIPAPTTPPTPASHSAPNLGHLSVRTTHRLSAASHLSVRTTHRLSAASHLSVRTTHRLPAASHLSVRTTHRLPAASHLSVRTTHRLPAASHLSVFTTNYFPAI
jgi:hypothetical protein